MYYPMFYPQQACLRVAVNLLSIMSLRSSLPQRHYTLTRIGPVEVKNIALSDPGKVIRADAVIGRKLNCRLAKKIS
jgi:hypothetical protein